MHNKVKGKAIENCDFDEKEDRNLCPPANLIFTIKKFFPYAFFFCLLSV